jgi:hypothetical protein
MDDLRAIFCCYFFVESLLCHGKWDERKRITSMDTLYPCHLKAGLSFFPFLQNGQTPLHRASQEGYKDLAIVKLLLLKKADPKATDKVSWFLGVVLLAGLPFVFSLSCPLT